jgi:hypothetical protein
VSAEGRERFFRAIAERIDTERVEEVHVFPAIRQGGRESGVAVVTIRLEETEDAELPAMPEESATSGADQAPDGPDVPAAPDASAIVEQSSEPTAERGSDSTSEPTAEQTEGPAAEVTVEPAVEPTAEPIDEPMAEPTEVDSFAGDVYGEALVEATTPTPPRRFTVVRAHYMLMLKGPDRGKWEVGVVEEADAPAATVDEVVRGVHERAGGWGGGADVPERLTGDDFRAALVDEPWTATP